MNGKKGQGWIILLKIGILGILGAVILDSIFHTELAKVIGFIIGGYIGTKI